MPRFLTAAALLVFALIVFPATTFAEDIPDRAEGQVVKIESGEVIHVKLADGKRLKVRVIGIDCGKKSNSAAAQLVGRDRITLRSDKQFLPILQDQFGRYVAYVEMNDGRDLGLEMLKTGQCSSSDWNIPHPKKSEYASASN